MSNILPFPSPSKVRDDALLVTVDMLARVKVQDGPEAAHSAAIGMMTGALVSIRVARGPEAALQVLEMMRASLEHTVEMERRV